MPQARIYTIRNTSVVQLPTSINFSRIERAVRERNGQNRGITFRRQVREVTIMAPDPRRKLAADTLLAEARSFAEALGCTVVSSRT